MNIVGEKVHIKDCISSDYSMEIVWQLDQEVTAADPIVGKVSNAQRFSIYTLDSKHIGVCALYNRTIDDIQLGIRIGDKDYWNKGYGTNAVNILVNYCAVTMNIKCIWLKVLPWNTQAIKCYEKCGFVRTGWLALDGYDFIRMERWENTNE